MFEVNSKTSYLTTQIRILILCHVTLKCWVSGSWYFKGLHYLHLQGSVVFICSWPFKMQVTHSFKKYRTNTVTVLHHRKPESSITLLWKHWNFHSIQEFNDWFQMVNLGKCISVTEVAKCYEVNVSTSWFRSNWLTDWLHAAESFLRS